MADSEWSSSFHSDFFHEYFCFFFFQTAVPQDSHLLFIIFIYYSACLFTMLMFRCTYSLFTTFTNYLLIIYISVVQLRARGPDVARGQNF